MIYYSEQARETALANIHRLRVRLAELSSDVLGRNDTVDIIYYLNVLASAIESEQRHDKLLSAERRRRNKQ